MRQWVGGTGAAPRCAPPHQLPWSVLRGTAAPGGWGSSKGRGKAAVPALREGLGSAPCALPTTRSLQSFHDINGFPRSELANEPAWEAAGAEGPRTWAVEGASGSS